MFDSIVWATDGSRRADQALARVRELCDRYGSVVRVVHVVPMVVDHIPSTHLSAQERTIAKLKAQTTALRRHGINASLHVIRGATGSPAPHIVTIAQAVDAGLLIVAGRGRSPLQAVLMGSVSQELIGSAPCPVLVVPAAPRPQDATAAAERGTPAHA